MTLEAEYFKLTDLYTSQLYCNSLENGPDGAPNADAESEQDTEIDDSTTGDHNQE